MTKKDLMTGDIIVNRGGYLGVVLMEREEILYKYIGSDPLDDLNSDLTFIDADYKDGDIMEVYRDTNFLDIENGDVYPIYQRDFNWKKATDKNKKENQGENKMNISNDSIKIIAQGFYGNRTATEIKRKDINFFLKGILSPEIFPNEDKKVDRKMVRVPNTDNIVIVYDQNEENECINEAFPKAYERNAVKYKERTGKDFTMYVTCKIPEINFKIHTRCFACRIGEDGELYSLENGDSAKFIEYFVV